MQQIKLHNNNYIIKNNAICDKPENTETVIKANTISGSGYRQKIC